MPVIDTDASAPPGVDLDVPLVPARHVPRRRVRALVAAGLAVAAMIFAPLAVLTRGAPPDPPAWPESAGAVAVLQGAAAAAERAADPAPRPGQARYLAAEQSLVEVVPAVGGRYHVVEERTLTEEWVPADPREPWLQRVQGIGAPVVWDARAHAFDTGDPAPPTNFWGSCGSYYPTPGEDPCARPGLWEDPTPAFLAGLPRDPRALCERLRADAADNGRATAQDALELAGQALNRGLLPARYRALLYRALAFLPGLAVTERHVPLGGGSGLALGIGADGEALELVLAPLTGVYLGQRRRLTAARDGLPAGRIIGQTTVRSRIVAAAGRW